MRDAYMATKNALLIYQRFQSKVKKQQSDIHSLKQILNVELLNFTTWLIEQKQQAFADWLTLNSLVKDTYSLELRDL